MTSRSSAELRVAIAIVFAAGLAAAIPTGARADTFSDDTCPNATSIGRHLNDLTATPSPMSDDLMKTARAFANAYRDCVASVDQNQYNNRDSAPAGGSVNDSVDVDRLYARVAYARALRRVAQYATESGDGGEARTAYAAGHQTLEQAAQIGGSIGPGQGGARHLVDEARELETQMTTEQQALGSASPQPTHP